MATLTPGLICELALKAVLTAEKDVAWERSVRMMRGVIILVERGTLNRICRTIKQGVQHVANNYQRDCADLTKRHIIAVAGQVFLSLEKCYCPASRDWRSKHGN